MEPRDPCRLGGSSQKRRPGSLQKSLLGHSLEFTIPSPAPAAPVVNHFTANAPEGSCAGRAFSKRLSFWSHGPATRKLTRNAVVIRGRWPINVTCVLQRKSAGNSTSGRLLGRLKTPVAYQRVCWAWNPSLRQTDRNEWRCRKWESKDAEVKMSQAFQ